MFSVRPKTIASGERQVKYKEAGAGFDVKPTIEIDREDDGRWIAEVPKLPGVLCYGATQREAMAKAEALAFRVIAEQFDHGEAQPPICGRR